MKRVVTLLSVALLAALSIQSADATRFVKQSTSRVVRICGVVAVGDGYTPVTTLSLSTADEAEALRENTATYDISGATWAAVTSADGCYSLTLDTTATNTVGELVIEINDDSLVLPIWESFTVLPANVYDSLIGGTDTLQADVTQFGGSAGTFASGIPDVNAEQWNNVDLDTTNPLPNAAADAAGGLVISDAGGLDIDAMDSNVSAILTDTGTTIPGTITTAQNDLDTITGTSGVLVDDGAISEASYDTTAGSFWPLQIVDQGTAQSATATTLVLRSAATFADDELIGHAACIATASAGAGQCQLITDYANATDTATVDGWVTTPSGTITYKIIAVAPGASGSLTAADVWSYVGTRALTELDEDNTTIDLNASAIGSIASGGISEATFGTTGSFGPFGIVDMGTAQSATSSTLVLRSAAAFANDELIGATCLITGGSTGVGQSRTVSDYVNSTDTATLDQNWTTTPTGTITYTCFGTAPGSSGLTQADIRTAVGLASANLDTQLGTVDTNVDSVLVDTGTTLPALFGTPAGADFAADIAAVKSDTAATLTDTGTTLPALLGTPAGADFAADIAAVKVDTAATLVDTGTTLPATLGTPADTDLATDIANFVATVGTPAAADVSTDIANIATTLGTPADTDVSTDIANLPTAAENSAQLLSDQRILTGTCSSGSTTTCIDAALTQADPSQIEDRLICFDDSWCGLVTTFTPASDTVTTTKTAPSTRASKVYTIFPATAQ